MKTNIYIDFIKNVIASDGYQIADRANKEALAAKAITIEQYSKAAGLIAQAFLDTIEV